MGSYTTDNSRKQIKLEVKVISPGDAATLCFLDATEILASADNFGGNIPSIKIGVNKDLKSSILKIQMATDLTSISADNRKKALEMIKVTSILVGGPKGKKEYPSNKSERIILGDIETIIFTKEINFK